MYLTTIAIVAMTAVAWRRRVPNRAFILVPFLLICQILLGALNVWLGKHPGLIVAHLTLATILWATVVYAAASLVEVPAGTSENAAGSRSERHAGGHGLTNGERDQHGRLGAGPGNRGRGPRGRGARSGALRPVAGVASPGRGTCFATTWR